MMIIKEVHSSKLKKIFLDVARKIYEDDNKGQHYHSNKQLD